MDDAPDATATDVFAALAAQLRQRGILTRRDGDALAVLDTDGEQVDTITRRRRPSDWDRWWFWDCEDKPLAEADNPIAAALAIVSTLARSGARV